MTDDVKFPVWFGYWLLPLTFNVMLFELIVTLMAVPEFHCADENSMVWFDAYMTKKTPKISQPGIVYMLQGGGSASNSDPYAMQPKQGENWMTEPPHIMIFPTAKLDTKIYSTDPMTGGPYIMWAGTPYEHLMVPVGQMKDKERMEK